MSMKPYTLSSEQHKALMELLYVINLSILSDSGEVAVNDHLITGFITKEQGQVIEDMFYTEEFQDEDYTESE